MKTQKEINREYKSMKFRTGISQIKNKQENKIYLQTSTDLDRAFNSDIFQLKAGIHSNKILQKDWNNLSSEVFEFAIYDEFIVKDTATPTEIDHELKELLNLHLAELKKNGQLFY